MTRLDLATEAQNLAADPAASTWLSANAGSGKTRVLTDRVARLLFRDTPPQHILCLTYTKAAAAEMQNRLFRRLGEWSMAEDAVLRHELARLGETGPFTHHDLARARRLFARALESPGGLRIQTIHSFCAALLRRFPIEAGVSPGFSEIDDRAAKLLRQSIIEDIADRVAPAVMEDMALMYSGADFPKFADQIVGRRADFQPPRSEGQLRAALGVAPDESEAAILADVLLGGEAELIAEAVPHLLASSAQDQRDGRKLAAIDLTRPTLATLQALEDVLLVGSGGNEGAARIGKLPTKALAAGALAPLLHRLDALMLRVEAARPRRLSLVACRRAVVLHRFAGVFLAEYQARKAAGGWLDFDDLITATVRLLTDRAVAAWVLFRLDGGIDHVLVDEAQDTSPAQWRVVECLTAEFTAGAGARPTERTLFVVGDKKQSIYSFQGADVAGFEAMSTLFEDRFKAAGKAFQSLPLHYSFRSAPEILRLVDDTFGARFPRALGDGFEHNAFLAQLPGRVDLWPIIPPADGKEDVDWQDTLDRVSETHHNALLADRIADRIARMIEDRVQIPARDRDDPSRCRPVHAGDFLILVRRRSGVFPEIIRACKAAGLPIAGADRLKLGGELAVRDLAALLKFLATPEDDLSLAALLRSPLIGLTEDELFRLAHGRGPAYLWDALRNARARHPQVLDVLDDLRTQADFLRPYDLIERALTRHDGRRRLIARLGAEAEDGIDELLSQALAFERNAVPGLTGFIHWLETDDVDVKRQMDSAGRRIRVMTVHGAKGLEAPIVILPDTADATSRNQDAVLVADGTPLWSASDGDGAPAIAAAKAARKARQAEEDLRLLYVALTRAETWLIVCGAGKDTAKENPCWHKLVAQGMEHAGATRLNDGGMSLVSPRWPVTLGPAKAAPAEEAPRPAPPDWLHQPAPDAQRPPQPLAPSQLGGAKTLPGDDRAGDAGDEAATRRGTALHLLLQHLPDTAPGARPALARMLVPDDDLRADILPEALGVLDHPDFAHLFAPGTLAEVAVTAPLPQGAMLGSIDRLILSPTQVLAVDYKSNRLVPSAPEAVPLGLLRQMAAYQHALKQIYPGRAVEVAILWTGARLLMPLPAKMLRAALDHATSD